MTIIQDVSKLEVLIPATVEALTHLGGSASNDEIHDKVVELLQLTDDIVEFPHKEGSSLTRLRYRLHWARTYLKKAGAVDNTQRGVWTLTPRGRVLSSEEMAEIPRVVRAMNRAERQARIVEEDGDDEELSWAARLLGMLQAMPPDAFERLCQRVLRESGFTKVEVTGRSGDGGIDGNGVLRVKLVSFQVLFQSKRWQGSLGAPVVRDFRGAMVGRADKGLIITTGSFTSDARREATRDGAPAIDLVDGDDLCQLLKELKIGVNTKLVEEVEIDSTVFESI